MRCDLCGTKVKVFGDTTKHYELVVDRDKLFKTIIDFRAKHKIIDAEDCDNLTDAIISAMYGTVDNVATVERGEK